jgi:hypothetical protein
MMTFTSTDGKTFQGTVDGRALEPFSASTPPDALRFVDGRPGPKFKIKRAVLSLLRKLAQANPQSCSAGQPTAGASVRPLDLGLSACELCQDECTAIAFVAEASALGALAACVAVSHGVLTIPCAFGFATAYGAAEKGLLDCYGNCQEGSKCCPVPCAGGTPNQDCVLGTCSENAVCCGGVSNPKGQCCDNATDCCGATSSTCLEGIFAGYKCADVQTGAFCYPGQGDVCADTSMPGLYNGAGVLGSGSACCPADSPVCRDATNHVCCSSGAGDVCGNDCCQASTPHCDTVGKCCVATDTCGPTGECCPAPHVCLGSVCCNPPDNEVCTGILTGVTGCCDRTVANCNHETGACCPLGQDVCGVHCCDSSQVCTGVTCCPRNLACGNVCCQQGQFCADPSMGTCSPCPPGLQACQPNGGGPAVCCAVGEACCAGPPPVCCTNPNAQMCCGTPHVECQESCIQ